MSNQKHDKKSAASEPACKLQCEEIEAALFDYMSREIGESRAILVREHLRKCSKCRRSAAEIGAAIDLLRKASLSMNSIPDRLSDDRRRRIRWAFLHPVLDWFVRRHVIVSILITFLVLLVVTLFLIKAGTKKVEEEDRGIGVTIGTEGLDSNIQQKAQ